MSYYENVYISKVVEVPNYYYELKHLPTGTILSSTGNACNNSFSIYEELINKFLNI